MKEKENSTLKNKLKESENHIKEIEKKNSSQAAAMNDLETTVKRMKSEIEKKNKYEQEKTILIYHSNFLRSVLNSMNQLYDLTFLIRARTSVPPMIENL